MSDDELDAAIDDIGVIARVTPEDKVRLVDTLKRKGHIVAMTGDGVNDAPALKTADIGIAMGITGTEVSKEAATMILTDDNFATIVKAVELGRGLYDNLTKYIRFQMGVLIGFIVTFLGASIFNIVGGVPFVPLQTLYVNFTTQVFQAIGLGYGRPAEGLMKRKPRASDEPILPRPLLLWVGDRRARARRRHARRDRAGPTTTTAAAQSRARWASRRSRSATSSSRSPRATSGARCSRSTCSRTGCSCTAPAARSLAILFGTELGIFQRILGTVHLDLHQWLVCIVVGLAIIPVSEARRLLLQRRSSSAGDPSEDTAAVAAS